MSYESNVFAFDSSFMQCSAFANFDKKDWDTYSAASKSNYAESESQLHRVTFYNSDNSNTRQDVNSRTDSSKEDFGKVTVTDTEGGGKRIVLSGGMVDGKVEADLKPQADGTYQGEIVDENGKSKITLKPDGTIMVEAAEGKVTIKYNTSSGAIESGSIETDGAVTTRNSDGTGSYKSPNGPAESYKWSTSKDGSMTLEYEDGSTERATASGRIRKYKDGVTETVRADGWKVRHDPNTNTTITTNSAGQKETVVEDKEMNSTHKTTFDGRTIITYRNSDGSVDATVEKIPQAGNPDLVTTKTTRSDGTVTVHGWDGSITETRDGKVTVVRKANR